MQEQLAIVQLPPHGPHQPATQVAAFSFDTVSPRRGWTPRRMRADCIFVLVAGTALDRQQLCEHLTFSPKSTANALCRAASRPSMAQPSNAIPHTAVTPPPKVLPAP